MQNLLRVFLTSAFAASILVAGASTSAPSVSAATLAATTICSNGIDNTPGLGLICEVTVANTITPLGGSSTVTVRECHGAAGDPEAACTTVTSVLTTPVTVVDQCNDATNGGGGTLRCSVDVTNTYVGLSPTVTAATVNQCVGSGGGITIGCDPFPATTTGATITQCNGSANGGTLVELTCTATGTQSSAFAVTINQCNGSTNGGGALVNCSADSSDIVIAAPTPTPTPTAAPTATPTPGTEGAIIIPPGGNATTPPTDTTPDATESVSTESTGWILLLVGLLVLASVVTVHHASRPR
jgi:hypothetical protein